MELLVQFVRKVMPTVCLLGFLILLVRLFGVLVLNPYRLRWKLRKQGINGPPSSFLLGNVYEILNNNNNKSTPLISAGKHQAELIINHSYSSLLFPCFEQWRQQYGSVFMFSLGNIQLVYMGDPGIVKEMCTCISLGFGKPSYQHKERGPLLGQGILTSNGTSWARHRKIIAPQLYLDKVKGMTKLMVEASVVVLNSWQEKVEVSEGGVADITVDDYIRSFAGDAISRACFGSSYVEAQQIFMKLGALERAMLHRTIPTGVPLLFLNYLKNYKSNREMGRLGKEVRALILKAARERKTRRAPDKATETEPDLLRMMVEAGGEEENMLDNCLNMYLAGYESTALSAAWTLMLLASNPHWQDRVRSEVFHACGGRLPDADDLRRMKLLTMVIQESLRLYPPAPIVSREALQDLKFGHILIPKGVAVWIPLVTLHQDPDIWGPDAALFRPERFAQGATQACKLPQVYMPFGMGPRNCLGQHFAMAELKVILSRILSTFSFTLSPDYVHSPVLKLSIKPQHGVRLRLKKLSD
ncbi:cytochrome P450 714C2-like [Malania oleifera]|uniref:cytochrome P450 714C2-like n=1 Tax=Malania oleifera TaxID=397392 RepID=UPI0025AE2AB1|nr:cytochrome P450 714C2-like [Malania oleifera]